MRCAGGKNVVVLFSCTKTPKKLMTIKINYNPNNSKL